MKITILTLLPASLLLVLVINAAQGLDDETVVGDGTATTSSSNRSTERRTYIRAGNRKMKEAKEEPSSTAAAAAGTMMTNEGAAPASQMVDEDAQRLRDMRLLINCEDEIPDDDYYEEEDDERRRRRLLCESQLEGEVLESLLHEYESTGFGGDLVDPPFTHGMNQNDGSGAQCMTFKGESFDHLVNASSTVFVTMPAKAGGTSMKTFTYKCTGKSSGGLDKLINETSVSTSMEHLLLGDPKPHDVLAMHLLNEHTFEVLVENIPRDALVIYIHREETSRLISAIWQVLYVSCARGKHRDYIVPTVDGIQCTYNERELLEQVIEPKIYEIGWGGPEIMTCGFYETIERNFPRMVFMNYKQVDELQAAIAKHKCPEVETPVSKNIGSDKDGTVLLVKLDKSGKVIPLDDWLEEMRDMLEWTMQLKGGSDSCQAKTRTMEDELYACEDELLQVTRNTSF